MNKKKRIPRLCCIGTVILAMILTGCVRRQSPYGDENRGREAECGDNAVSLLRFYAADRRRSY